MTPPGVPAEYFAAAFLYGMAIAHLLNCAVDALRDWRRQRQSRGQRSFALEVPAAPAITWEPNRLRYRSMPLTYAQLKGGDTLFVAPTDTAGDPEEIVGDLIRRNPALASKLQATALRVAMTKGAITSDDVREALDDETRAMLDAASSKTVMAAAWHPRKRWQKTGVYLPSRNPDQNKRPVAQWRLREAA